MVIVPAGDEDEAGVRGVTHEWRDELNDSREDIYSLTDGEPIDGAQ